MQVTKTTFLSEIFVSSSKLSIEILMDEIQNSASKYGFIKRLRKRILENELHKFRNTGL